MGHVIVRILLNGENIFEAGSTSPEIRGAYNKYRILDEKYGLHRFEEIPTQGDDFNIDFNADELSDSIDWNALEYPSEKVRELIKAFVERHPLAQQLDKTMSEIAGVTFETRYSLPRLGQRALDIISKVPVSNYISYDGINSSQAFSAIHHTLGKEVEMLTGMKPRDSKASKEQIQKSAIRHLSADIDSFRCMMFSIKDSDE